MAGAGDELLVPREDAFLQVEVVLQSDADVASEEDRVRRHGQLHPRHARDDVRRPGRKGVPHVDEVLDRRGDSAVHAHHELEMARLFHEARLAEIAAPSCSRWYAASAISSGVTGTWGVSFFLGAGPVRATVTTSFSMASSLPA